MIPLLACIAFLGCRDLLSSDTAAAPAVQARMLGDVTCTVTPRESQMVCVPSPGTVPAAGHHRAILGNGQIKMASTNVSVDTAAHVFQAIVTVQNLLAYPLGTPDGTTVSGVKVFYFAGPTVTAYMAPGDTGTVTVRNADSTGNFTAARQPYYLYDQILQPNAVSAPKLWQWNYPRTVKSFSFQVKVFAATPGEVAVPLSIPASWGQPRRYFREPYQMNCGKIGIPRCVYDVVDIKFRADATAEERRAAIDAIGGTLESGSRLTARYYVQIPGDTTLVRLQAAVGTLRKLPQVEWAYPHSMTPIYLHYLRPEDGPDWQRRDWRVADSVATGRTWALGTISAPFAWGCENGDQGAQVAVVDHNFRTTPDLSSTYATDYSSGIDEYSLPQDSIYHGTEISSIIGAKGNDGHDMTGVLWRAALRVYEIGPDTAAGAPFRNSAGAAVLDVDTAFARIAAAGEAGAPIVNVSLGIEWNAVGVANGWIAAGSSYRPDRERNVERDSSNRALVRDYYLRFRDVLDSLAAHGKRPLIVLSAGNNELDASWNGLALAADSTSNVIVVGAARDLGQGRLGPMSLNVGAVHYGSNFGHLVRIAAPGQGVWSWSPRGPTSVTGTSFAAPYVTGAAALLVAFDPRLRDHPDSLISLLIQGARNGRRKIPDVGAPQTDSIPVVNVYESLRLAAQRPGAPLCGNRVWAQGGQLLVQRDTATGAQPEVLQSAGVQELATVLHGGKRVAYYGTDSVPHMLAWNAGAWAQDASVTDFSQIAGPAMISSQGYSHDRDSAVSAYRTSAGIQLDIRVRVAPFTNSAGAPVYNWDWKTGPVVPAPAPTSSYTWVHTARLVEDWPDRTMIVDRDSAQVGTSSQPSYSRVAFDPAGGRVLIAVQNTARSTAASEWARCPGWETDEILTVEVSSGEFGERHPVTYHRRAECRDVRTTSTVLPATVYSVALGPGTSMPLYQSAGGVDEISISDGRSREFYVRSYEQAETTDATWAAGPVDSLNSNLRGLLPLRVHPVSTRTMQVSRCANQYRSLDQPGTILFQVTATQYNTCPSLPFSFAPDRLAGNGSLFPALAPAPAALAQPGTLRSVAPSPGPGSTRTRFAASPLRRRR